VAASDELLSRLARAAQLYPEHALRFTCLETVRLARYDEASEPRRNRSGGTRISSRRKRSADAARVPAEGQGRRHAARRRVRDEEPFPPAYAWVQLFGRFNQSFFVYRDQGERIDGTTGCERSSSAGRSRSPTARTSASGRGPSWWTR